MDDTVHVIGIGNLDFGPFLSRGLRQLDGNIGNDGDIVDVLVLSFTNLDVQGLLIFIHQVKGVGHLCR